MYLCTVVFHKIEYFQLLLFFFSIVFHSKLCEVVDTFQVFKLDHIVNLLNINRQSRLTERNEYTEDSIDKPSAFCMM